MHVGTESTNHPTGTQALVVEFVLPGGFVSLPVMPFIKGLLEDRGVRCRWLRFAVTAGSRARKIGPGVEISAGDRASMIAAARALRATHVLFSQRPADPVIGGLASTGARLGVVDQAHALSEVENHASFDLLPASVLRIASWILGGPVMEELPRPDYRCEPANRAAARMRPFFYILAGRACTWDGRLAESRFFAGEAGLPERWGCTFCAARTAWSPALEELESLPVEQVLAAQIDALAGAMPRGGPRPELRVLGVRAGPVLVARMFARSRLPPADILLEYRADHVVRRAAAIEEAADSLGGTGHRLVLGLLGIESFSAAQLDRYHKGYTPEANMSAIRTIREVASRRPETLVIRPDSALSFIVFDPWATPGDVALSIVAARRLGLAPLCRRLLGSRLRLYDGLPLTAKARADGLIVDAYYDPLLDTAARTLYQEEVPWRFADPRMDPLCRILVRIDAGGVRDELSRLLPGGERTRSDLALAEALCHAAAGSREELAPGDLISRARATSSPLAPCEWISARPGDRALQVQDFHPFQHFLDFAMFDAGIKPVMKLEEPFGEQTLRRRLEQVESAWPGAAVRTRLPAWGGGRAVEIFVGREPADCDRAVSLAELLDTTHDSDKRRSAAIAFGLLMGYPECCARAFAAEGHVSPGGFERMRIAKRIAAPEMPLPPFHPLLVGHVPCSVGCEATRMMTQCVISSSRAASWLDRWAEAFAEDPSDSWRDWGGLPLLQFLDRPGQFAVLRPTAVEGSAMRCSLACAFTTDPRAEALRQGDTLILDPGLIRVISQGVEIGFFAMDAFLWETGQARYAAFWREWALAEAPASGEGGQPPLGSGLARLKARCEVLARRMENDPADPLRGFRVVSIQGHPHGPGWGRLAVTLARAGDRMTLNVAPRTPESPCLFETRRFRVSHDRETPLDTEDKREVARKLATGLDEARTRKGQR